MAKRKVRRKRKVHFGKASVGKTAWCELTPENAKFMRWATNKRAGSLDKEFLRSARHLARRLEPAKAAKKLANTMRYVMAKKKFSCLIGQKSRLCTEISLMKPDYTKISGCYMSRVKQKA